MRYLKYFSDIFLIVCLFLNISLFADALPQGESVVSGNAQFDSSQQNSLQVTVSDKAIINYDSFSIASSESVNFIQPSSSSIVLNRVIGIDPSEIFGSLSANGRIFLLNPNGILFGSGSRIDVSGLLASTLDIADDGFLSGAYNFKEGTGSSYIINKGVINAENGFVVLQSPLVSNEGVITATVGDVVVAGTTRSEVVFDGDGLISFVVPKIQDVLGDILIPQEYASSLIQGIVNTPAIIEAGQVIEEDGIIKLVGVSGLAVNDGIINVNGSSGHDAGSILITSGQASVINEGSLISANGIGENSSGGQIQILSEGISAVGPRATLEVRGGEISGNGGFVEVSGQDFMVDPLALFHLGAVYGTNGLFLLDPNNVTIRNNASSNTNMDVSTSTWFTTTDSAVVDVGLLAIALQSGNITIQTRSGLPTAPQAGNINVINSIDINNANGNQLILQAHNNITLDAAVFTDSNLATNDAVSLTLTADRDTSGVGSIDINAAVNTYGGALSTTGIDFDNTGGAITTKGGSVTIANTGAVTVGAAINTTGGTGLINFSAPTTVTLKSNLSTDGGNIKVQTGSVIIGANVTLDTESGNNSDSGDILLVERNISANAVGYDLTLDTRTGAGYASGDISIGSIDNTAGAFLNDVNITAIGGSADPFTNCGTITLDGNVSVDEDVSGKPGSVAINAKVRMTDSVTIDTEQGGDDNAGVIDMPYANIAAATDNAYDLTLDTSTAGGIGGQLTWYKCGHFEGSGSAYYVRNLTVTSAGSVSAGAISLTGGATTTGTQLFTAGTGGSVTLYGNLEAVNNNLTFAANTPVILANAATIKTGTGTLTFNSSLSSGNNDVTLAGNAIDLLGGAGSVSGTASISLAPASADKSIGISGGAGDLQLSAADIAALADGFSGIFIGRTDGGAAIRIGAAGITFNDPVTFRAPGVGGSIVVNGPITGLGNASMTLNSRGAPTLSGALSTNNSPISINVTSGNITVSDTAAFDIDAGSSTVTLSAGGADNTLTLNANVVVRGQGGVNYTADNMVLTGNTNAGTAEATLVQTTNTRQIDLGTETAGKLSLTDGELDTITAGKITIGNINSGAITFTDAITPGNAQNLGILSGGNIFFNSSIQVTGTIDITAQGSILDGTNAGSYDIISGGKANLDAAGGTVGLPSDPLEVSVGGLLYAGAGARVEGISAILTGLSSDNLAHLLYQIPGLLIFNGVTIGQESAVVRQFHSESANLINPYAIIAMPRFQSERLYIMDMSLLGMLPSPFLTQQKRTGLKS